MMITIHIKIRIPCKELIQESMSNIRNAEGSWTDTIVNPKTQIIISILYSHVQQQQNSLIARGNCKQRTCNTRSTFLLDTNKCMHASA